MKLETITPRWNDGRTVIVAAPGPALTEEVAERCRNYTVMAVKEAYRRVPWAEVMYGCDAKFWDRYDGCRDFMGERWSSHGVKGDNDKRIAQEKYGLLLVAGKKGVGFSFADSTIHYGYNSGFQSINLTLLLGATRLVLVGFNMKGEGDKRYFFGKAHPTQQSCTPYGISMPAFADAAKLLPKGITILNATADTALKAFKRVTLDEALAV
jgi:hypothetical protein